MNRLLSLALTLGLTATGGAAMACNSAVVNVTGHHQDLGLVARGCAYTSIDMAGRYSDATVFNHSGAVVAGVYGTGHDTQITNIGRNDVGALVAGYGHDTRIVTQGYGSDLSLRQTGAHSSVSVTSIGNRNGVAVDVR